MIWKVPLSDLNFNHEEEEAALRVLRSKWLSMGDETWAFEQEFSHYLGVEHAIAVASGTAALHLALVAARVGPGDAVIQPAVNFVSAANMTAAVGATPFFADIISLSEPTICPDRLRDLLSNRENFKSCRPKALVVMHYGGYPCRIKEIKAICEEQEILLIEDACHSTGAAYGSTKLGIHGDIGCFSFYGNKNLVTGEGGMLVTDSDHLAVTVRLSRSHGMSSLTSDRHQGNSTSYDVVDHGFNYRIDEMRAAIGRVQLSKLEAANRRRREITAYYWDEVAALQNEGWILPFTGQDFQDAVSFSLELSSCHLMPVVAPDVTMRSRCAEKLKEFGIQTSRHYPCIPGFSAFRSKFKCGDLSQSEQFCSRVITLPLFPGMSNDQTHFVSQRLLSAILD